MLGIRDMDELQPDDRRHDEAPTSEPQATETAELSDEQLEGIAGAGFITQIQKSGR